jgi:hypothetical protein
MENIEQLVDRATQVRSATLAYPQFPNAEKYAMTFNSWLLNRPTLEMGVIWCNAIFECSVLSESSLFLAVHGFYEEACAILRELLDGFLARLYWDIRNNKGELKERTVDGRSTNDYCEWEMGTADNYPRLKDDIWPTLLYEQRIAAYDCQQQLKAEISSRLKLLDRFVHNRPSSRHYGGASRHSSINIDFKSKHFDEWYENLREVYKHVFTLSLLPYPSLLETEIWNEFKALEPDHASKLVAFSSSQS